MHLSSYIGKYWTGAEVIYAVIIAMTFTSVLRTYIAIPGGSYFPMIYSALLCCIAWGIADGSFYIWERNHNLGIENDIIDICKSDRKGKAALPLISEQLENTIISNISEEKRLELYRDLILHLAATGKKETVSTRDALYMILGTSLISTASGVIVVLPFFLSDKLIHALAMSNLLGILLLFITGYYRTYEKDLYGKVRSGFGTTVIGMSIAAITILLGG
ncbi:MAG: VIT family protein [Methanomethylovorans sp. PtaU1.Bin093]|uniref:VIT1/CCC1 transporter family protein n=1 Tax=Methanomethylovorans sp. PtaU1.Bin093 TaxID=1811679 RepID=UPI0009CC4276|nr:VIT1/CCC1 transporter family protein [Methanomethylovorans sp. PtaU1.Bin093]OPY21195.1 MAG: VIT family protein [Methanomethylovorans sp. PtaU1.Bin093]